MLSLTLAGLRSHSRRMISAGLAIVLGVAFVAATLVLSSTMQASTEKSITADLGSHAAVVTAPDHGVVRADALYTIRATTGVTAVSPTSTAFVRIGAPARFADVSTAGGSGTGTVAQGRLPRRAGEVAVSETAARSHDFQVGSRTTVVGAGGEGDSESVRTRTTAVTVVGVIDQSDASQRAAILATNADIESWRGSTGFDRVVVDGPDSVVSALSATLGSAYDVRSGADQAEVDVDDVLGDANILTTMLLGFAAVALFVAAMVIGNTFSILLAQRTREMALLRCVGATRSQVRRTVLAESVGLGLIASIVGVAAGIGLARAATAGINSTDSMTRIDGLAVSPRALVVPLVVGLVVTVVAAVRPAYKATRVAPLVALRPEAPVVVKGRAGRVRLAVAGLLTALGAALMVAGVALPTAVAAVAGAMVSFLGVMMLAPVVVPAFARLLGRPLARLAGTPGELAADNVARNTRRTAATSTALLVGVALISAMTVAAGTGRATVEKELDRRSPVDVTVASASERLPGGVRDAVARVDGVAATATVTQANVRVGGSARTVVAVDPTAAASVLRNDDTVSGLRSGVIVVPESIATGLHVKDGSQLRVGDLSLRVETDGRDGSLLMTTSDLRQVAPHAPVAEVWSRIADGADADRVMGDIGAATKEYDGLSVDGGATQRLELQKQTDVILLIVTGLLAVAVLIALVGVANTLGLSVLERTRESALLRALGLTRRQLRLTVLWEALLVGGAGALGGVALGLVYGMAGSLALLRELTDETVPAFSWSTLALVAVGAALAGVLASVLPARRAARIAPASGLASD
ncbi:FtsX-like permease family protein [Luteipulveratus halotolerans]|uniref:ABC3 transporter permease C-terminal domain-containing protein n=1 Tax=Luteipulveratus halotolerans TaxID=1631356 RepID=A0A0L6CL28_9MICO|nr:ABC transporter permease [Luteipulveratus halotolerans]KNX38452.1 hypothetical protein VV01_16975 [Luteipulveratus halotolerans]